MKEKSLFRKIYDYFDKLEDRVRAWLSKSPLLYAFVAGIAIVIFWRGIWHFADMLEAEGGILGFIFWPPVSIVLSIAVLLATGLFVSFFVGDVIIMSGLKKEKKFIDRAREEIEAETAHVEHIEDVLEKIEEEVAHIHNNHTGPKTVLETKTEQRSGGGVQPKA